MKLTDVLLDEFQHKLFTQLEFFIQDGLKLVKFNKAYDSPLMLKSPNAKKSNIMYYKVFKNILLNPKNIKITSNEDREIIEKILIAVKDLMQLYDLENNTQVLSFIENYFFKNNPKYDIDVRQNKTYVDKTEVKW